ncbi:MAG: hypothetical protein NC078_04720 [Ruminococcus sp.]|nr:hypothetical protein [Ruminococcus sp.]
MKFEYNRPKITVEAYGETFEMPTKTIAVVDGVAKAQKEIAESKDTAEQIKAIKRGIAVFIGDEAVERLFPENTEDTIDTDEISAFWFCLNSESNKATQAVIEKYSPNRVHVPIKK